MESELAYRELVTDGPKKLGDMLQAMRAFLGQNDMMAYLTMMAQRMAELHRVLKPTGSLYLHCDPTASHYLKLLLDAVFGSGNFKELKLSGREPRVIATPRALEEFTMSSSTIAKTPGLRGTVFINR